MGYQEYKKEKVIGEFKGNLNGPKGPFIHLILTEESFYLVSKKIKAHITRKDYFTYDIIDNIYGCTIVLREHSGHTISIACNDRIQFINLFSFLDKIELTKETTLSQ